jgi:nitroimidazol reductase NimA-like FMN-containing flavoprotein (pyridoxamine 5'-phosphate oxidase superfamily)
MLPLTPAQIDERLAAARIGRLCMATSHGEPYVIPMPFCWHAGSLYLRIPMKGRKGAILAENPRVCFEIDWCSDTLDDYGSVLVEGRLERVIDLAEKARAKAANDDKYDRLRNSFRPGHGRSTPLEELALRKIIVTARSGRRREDAPVSSPAETGAA